MACARCRPEGLVALVALVAAAACGSGEEFSLHGARVVVATDAPFAREPDFRGRIESTVDVALSYWGGSWDDLDGALIELTGAPSVSCGGVPSLGCWDGEIRITTQDPGMGTFACIEQTTLVHEVGHAVVGDPLHEDPRWMSFDAAAQKLAGRVGYTTDGVTECILYPSVWRHPLGTP
jgi:hypothetical protein